MAARGGSRVIVRIGLYIIASWLLAAHFLRTGDLIPTAMCLATPLLFFVRRGWSLLALQLLAYAAAVIWLATAWQLVAMRQVFGQPWWRGAAILIAVAAFSVLVGLLMRGRALQESYRGR